MRTLIVVIGVLVIFVINNTPTNSAEENHNVFDTKKVVPFNNSSMYKWLSVIDRYEHQGLPSELLSLIESLENKRALMQLEKLREKLAEVRYIKDNVDDDTGINDFWATPKEFFGGGGDCEDFAISAFFVLKKLGFDNVKIIVVINYKLKLYHAVTVVKTEYGVYVIDNLEEQVYESSVNMSYSPCYAIDEDEMWDLRQKNGPCNK